jgi:uncharacterized protein (DUF1800 family)
MTASKSETRWISHLLRRAGFGATPDELKYYKDLGFDGSLEELLNPEKVNNDKLEDSLNNQEFDFTDLGDVKRWWINRMVYTKRPLQEKMTLFWHGHFATSNQKVNNPYLMYDQNSLMRKHALGRFGDLLLAMSKDPAMIIWLDNQQNKKGKPNENYAREIMELFTMGIGNYSEQDVKEAARAFTGWQAPRDFYFNRKQHDSGEKTFLGEKGNFNGEDVVAILAKKPATAKFLSRKLITFFSHDDPDREFVERVADIYLSSDQNMKEVLRTIFSDKSFRSDDVYHGAVKSPVELVVGTVKALQVQKLDGDLPSLLSRMGQNLLEPPNVKGWDGGLMWVATDTMMERFNFAARISTQKFDAFDGYINTAKLAPQSSNTPKDMVEHFLSILVDGDIPSSARKKLLAYVATDSDGKSVEKITDSKMRDAKMRGLIHLIMTLPTYQLA